MLVEALRARDAIDAPVGRVFVYALLGYAVETTDPDAVARFGRAQAADAQVAAAVAFVEPELLAVGPSGCRMDRGQTRLLAVYEPLLRRSRPPRRAHPLGRGRGGARPRLRCFVRARSRSTARSSTAISCSRPRRGATGATAEVTQGSIEVLLASPDRALRRSAWESYADGYLGVRNTLAANLAGRDQAGRLLRSGAPLRVAARRRRSPARTSRSRCSTT